MLTQAGVHEQDRDAGTALMLAISKGKTGVVEKLVAAGAKVKTTDGVKGREACTLARWLSCCQHPLASSSV